MNTPLSTDQIPTDQPLSPWQRLPRRTLTIALSVLPLVALANIGVLLWSLGGIDLAGRIAAPGLLMLAALLALVPMIANSLRLALWSRFLGLGLGPRGAFKVITGAMIANSVTPSAAGGAPIKLLFLISEGVSPHRAATVISFQTAEDALVIFSLVAVSVTFSGFQLFDFLAAQPGLLLQLEANMALAGWIVLGMISALMVLGGALLSGMLGKGLQRRAAGAVRRLRSFTAHIISDWQRVMRRGKGVALANLALAAVQWLVRFSIAGLVLAAFGEAWHPALYWLLQYLVQSISSVVPTPGGVGGAEAGFLLLFAPFVSGGSLVPAMSAWRLLFFYLPLAGAAPAFFVLHRASRQHKAPQTDSISDSPPHIIAHPAE